MAVGNLRSISLPLAPGALPQPGGSRRPPRGKNAWEIFFGGGKRGSSGAPPFGFLPRCSLHSSAEQPRSRRPAAPLPRRPRGGPRFPGSARGPPVFPSRPQPRCPQGGDGGTGKRRCLARRGTAKALQPPGRSSTGNGEKKAVLGSFSVRCTRASLSGLLPEIAAPPPQFRPALNVSERAGKEPSPNTSASFRCRAAGAGLSTVGCAGAISRKMREMLKSLIPVITNNFRENIFFFPLSLSLSP